MPADRLEAALAEFLAPVLKQTGNVLRGFKACALAARRGQPFEACRALEQDVFAKAWMHADHWAAVDRFLAGKA